MYRSYLLFCLCLLPSWAQSETAIGFNLLRDSGGLSLWRVNPRSMIGVGIDLDGYTSNRHSDRTGDQKSKTVFVYPSLTVIQIYRSDELAPLSYQRASARIDRDTNDAWEERGLFAEGEIGIGFIWRPPKKNVSLSLQQGISLLYRRSADEAQTEVGSDSTSSSWVAQTKSP